jgi:hypothetical protein
MIEQLINTLHDAIHGVDEPLLLQLVVVEQNSCHAAGSDPNRDWDAIR